MTAATRRINGKNTHSYKLDDNKVDGVTTVIGAGVPKPALPYWAAREVATFAVDNLDIITDLKRDEAIDLLKGVPWRERDRAARRGTEVHGYASQMIAGEEVDIPEELIGHVDSYIKFLQDFDVQPVLVEFVVGHHAHRWMGTGDLIGDFNDGLRRLVDIKTTRSGIYPDTTIQVAAYRNAEFYLDHYDQERPMIPVDTCAAVWVRADGYDLVPLDAGPVAYKIFRHAQEIAWWQKRDGPGEMSVGDVIQPTRGVSA